MGPKRKRHFAQRSDEEEIQSPKKPKAMTVSISGTSEDSQTLALQAQLMAELEKSKNTDNSTLEKVMTSNSKLLEEQDKIPHRAKGTLPVRALCR